MAEKTAISWASSTMNFWIGCAHAKHDDGTVFDECLKCYAERENAHWKWNSGSWGPGALRKITSESYWQQPFRWNEEAGKNPEKPWRVFSNSLADMWDEETPLWPAGRKDPFNQWQNKKKSTGVTVWPIDATARDVAFNSVIANTPNLTWMLLTKRFKACVEWMEQRYGNNPPQNVWIVFSAGTQASLEEAVEYGQRLKTTVFGISAEPLLGSMDPTNIVIPCPSCGGREEYPELAGCFDRRHGYTVSALERTSEDHMMNVRRPIDWIIAGGESGPDARPMRLVWERHLRNMCLTYGVPYFFKQAGAVPLLSEVHGVTARVAALAEREEALLWPQGTKFGNRTGNPEFNGLQVLLKHKSGADPNEWPESMKIQQFP